MYDLEVILPVTARQQHYMRRVNDFKRYGLLNVGDNKVILQLLVGDEHIADCDKGWPENVEPRIVQCYRSNIDVNNVVCKLYAFYADRDVSEWQESRWYMRVDDDSLTDISSLMDNLDSYDYKKDWYFTTEHHGGDTSIECNLLQQMGYSHLMPLGQNLNHELECGIFSQSAAYKIFTNEESRNFIEARVPINRGWTDIAIAAAAQLAKVYPIDIYFLSGKPYIGDFAYFGGPLCHVHKLSHDVNQEAFACIVSAVDSAPNLPEKYTPLIGQEYLFGRLPKIPIAVITLQGCDEKSFGFIQNGISENEKLWVVTDNKLKFLNIHGRITSVFELTDDMNYILGEYVLDSNINVKHFLRKLT